MVVLSPPGIISPSKPSSSRGRRTGKASTSNRRNIAMCSTKAPCEARTPILILISSYLTPFNPPLLFNERGKEVFERDFVPL
jgi:hypothetical protein